MEDNNKKIWEHYQKNLRNVFIQARPRFDYLAKLINRHKKSGSFLDIGLGDGYFIEKMAMSGYTCYGIDIAEESVEMNKLRIRRNGLEAVLKSGNINKIPFEDDKFDVISSSEVLEHLTDSDLNVGLCEIHRCLKNAGVFFATVPADENLQDNFCYCPYCKNTFHKWGHQQSFSRAKLEKIFRSNFKEVCIKKIPSIVYKPNLFEFIKFKIKWLLSLFIDNSYTGNYIIIAIK